MFLSVLFMAPFTRAHPTIFTQYNGGLDDQQPVIKPPFRHSNGQETSDDDLVTFLIISSITFASLVVVILLSLVIFWVVKRSRQLSQDELDREEENQAYLELNSDEQELYFQSKEFLTNSPYLVGNLTLSQELSIQEKGITAFEFQKDVVLTNNDLMILNKYELNFFQNFECSTQTNLPIPMKNEVYYFESKIYSLPNPDETIISIGLSIKPYPWFRLPGRHPHSICYDSNGYRRHNQPFPFTNDPPFPKLVEGDVIGVGYRTRSGTVFFTRNGKKISESKLGGHVKNFKISNKGQLFPIIGANNVCSVHVNLGQMGFVFIEGNVKHWGYAPLEGNGPAPPVYNKYNSDILLERSEIDDDDLSERENDFPPDFWAINGSENEAARTVSPHALDQDKFSYNAYTEVNSNDERITLASLVPPVKPPSYNEELEEGNSSSTINPMLPEEQKQTEEDKKSNDRHSSEGVADAEDNQNIDAEVVENDEVINDATQAEAFDITAENSNTVEADSININQTADVDNDTPE